MEHKTYIIVNTVNTHDLEQEVNYNLSNGYELVGGMSVVELSGLKHYYQAMIKIGKNSWEII